MASMYAPALGDWLRSAAIFFASGLDVAILASDWGTGVYETMVWLARAVIVAGGLLAGTLAARAVTVRRLIATMTAPLPTLAVAFLLMSGLSEGPADENEVIRILLIALALFDGAVIAAFAIRAERSRRRNEVLLPR